MPRFWLRRGLLHSRGLGSPAGFRRRYRSVNGLLNSFLCLVSGWERWNPGGCQKLSPGGAYG